MNKDYSSKWKSSKAPRKQRKYRFNAPLHVRGRFLSAMLSDSLASKHKKKNMRIRTGDKVKVMRGKYKGTEGKVEFVLVKYSKVLVTGIEVSKRDGSKAKVPLHASNLKIIELNTSDKNRVAGTQK